MAEEAKLIGDRIRERRKELGLSQREIAEQIPGSTQGADVSRWERGQHRPLSDTLGHIAKALHTDVPDLLAGPIAQRKKRGATPDPFASPDADQLDRIEKMLKKLVLDAALTDADQAVEDAEQGPAERDRRPEQSEPGSA